MSLQVLVFPLTHEQTCGSVYIPCLHGFSWWIFDHSNQNNSATVSKLTFQAASTGKPMNCRSWLPWCWVACHSFDLSPKTSDNYALLKNLWKWLSSLSSIRKVTKCTFWTIWDNCQKLMHKSSNITFQFTNQYASNSSRKLLHSWTIIKKFKKGIQSI